MNGSYEGRTGRVVYNGVSSNFDYFARRWGAVQEWAQTDAKLAYLLEYCVDIRI